MKSQEEMVKEFLPLIEKTGKVYDKFTEVEARIGAVGERIVTITADGKETENTVKVGDFVLHNLTEAGEQYILPATTFWKRYVLIKSDETKFPWSRYKATGSAQGIVWPHDSMKFIAAWGEAMQIHRGDMLVTPLPGKNEIYRIALKEFNETYRERQ